MSNYRLIGEKFFENLIFDYVNTLLKKAWKIKNFETKIFQQNMFFLSYFVSFFMKNKLKYA